jgi:hypothetical protein
VVSLNGPVLLFTILVTLLTVFIFGLAPALQVSRRDTNAVLRDTGKGVSGGFRHGRLRDALVVVEVALLLTLLAGAGLLIRSFVALQDVPLGLQPDHILVVRSALPQGRYKSAASITGFYRPLIARLQTLPGVTMLTLKGRAGFGANFSLSYNSQNWRNDSGGDWEFDGDVGYGFGWRLLAGSITPVWNSGGMTASYFLFMDSTGAEYRLDQNNSNVWSSKDSVYVYFDANTDILHFRNGTYWYFGCVSEEVADAGVMYPTLFIRIDPPIWNLTPGFREYTRNHRQARRV